MKTKHYFLGVFFIGFLIGSGAIFAGEPPPGPSTKEIQISCQGVIAEVSGQRDMGFQRAANLAAELEILREKVRAFESGPQRTRVPDKEK